MLFKFNFSQSKALWWESCN